MWAKWTYFNFEVFLTNIPIWNQMNYDEISLWIKACCLISIVCWYKPMITRFPELFDGHKPIEFKSIVPGVICIKCLKTMPDTLSIMTDNLEHCVFLSQPYLYGISELLLSLKWQEALSSSDDFCINQGKQTTAPYNSWWQMIDIEDHQEVLFNHHAKQLSGTLL